MNFGAYGPLQFFFWALLVAAFIVEAWAFIDAIRRPASAFVAASKQTKPIGLGGAVGSLALFSFLPIIGFVAAAIYLTDVKPKVSQFKGNSGGSGTHMGPYGPW